VQTYPDTQEVALVQPEPTGQHCRYTGDLVYFFIINQEYHLPPHWPYAPTSAVEVAEALVEVEVLVTDVFVLEDVWLLDVFEVVVECEVEDVAFEDVDVGAVVLEDEVEPAMSP
jgi:hypothetical protein